MKSQFKINIINCCIIVCLSFCFLTSYCFSQVSKITTGFSGKIIFNGVHPFDKNDYKRIYAATWSEGTIKIKAISPDNTPVASPIVNSTIGNKIIFRGDKLMVAAINNNVAQVTKSVEFSHNLPYFYKGILSPDGNKILFARKNRKTDFDALLYDIYVYDIIAGKTYQLTSTKHNVAPAWSPDGSKIAFYRGDRNIDDEDLDNPKNTQGYALAVMNSDGSNLQEIVTGSCIFDAYRDFPPQWSPDGKSILFDYRPTTEVGKPVINIDHGMGDLYIVHPDGSGLRLLIENKAQYSWSPDGTKIAVAAYYGQEKVGNPVTFTDSNGKIVTWQPTQPRFEIRLINADKSYDEVLLEPKYWATRPIWSPDGKWIAFQANGICLIHIETKTIIENITGDLVVQNDPVWLP